jgi:hypothetical protein
MQTDFPTTQLYFCFAFTYCRLKVYKTEEEFTHRLLQMCPSVELIKSSDRQSWQDVDTRLLMAIVSEAFAVTTERLTEIKKLAS